MGSRALRGRERKNSVCVRGVGECLLCACVCAGVSASMDAWVLSAVRGWINGCVRGGLVAWVRAWWVLCACCVCDTWGPRILVGCAGWRVWVWHPHTRTRYTRWVWNFPANYPLGFFSIPYPPHLRRVPVGYRVCGYPLPSVATAAASSGEAQPSGAASSWTLSGTVSL